MAACNKSYVVTGLGFGDEGKGSIVDALTKLTNASLVVRHNGGAQAAHNVVTPDGRHHTFSQWGSGTLATGCRTLLSSRTVLDPLAMLSECAKLEGIGVRKPFDLLVVDPDALVITPFHRATNRIREQLRGDGAHGSCGVGVGEAVADSLAGGPSIRWRDLFKLSFPAMLWEVRDFKLGQIQKAINDMGAPGESKELLGMVEFNQATANLHYWGKVMTALAESVKMAGDMEVISDTPGVIIYEGAQGVLLDQDFGFHPHTTWSKTTSENARRFIHESCRSEEDPEFVGVLRAFHTRHGAGPFPSATEKRPYLVRGEHNDGGFAGAFKYGDFEEPLARYAVMADPNITSIALTCLDRAKNFGVTTYDARLSLPASLQEQEANTKRLSPPVPPAKRIMKFVTGYPADLMPEFVADITGSPVRIQSWGPTAHDKKYFNFPLTRGA